MERTMNSKTRSSREGTIGAIAEGTGRPSRQDIFDVLRNRRRQCIIEYLQQNEGDGPFELGELVEYVTALEADAAPRESTPVERKRVYNALRQTHLPKLDDAGMITYDPETNRIGLETAARDAQRYLQYTPGSAIPWHTCYLGVSVAAAVVIGAHWFEISPLGGGSGGTIAGVVLAAFVVVAIIHAVDTLTNSIRLDGRCEPSKR